LTRLLATLASVSRIHIVAIAAMGTFTFGWLLTGRYLWLLALVCGVDWFVVNLLNRVVDRREDIANEIPGARFAAQHPRGLLVVGAGLLVTSFLLTWFWSPWLTLVRLAYHLLGYAYNWPLFPGRRRLKQLYFFKNSASALGFLITLFGYPMAAMAQMGGGPLPEEGIGAMGLLVAMAFFFPLELSYEVIYDLRDEPGDRTAEVATYPVVHGRHVAGRIIFGLCLVSFAILGLAYSGGLIPWRLAVMGAAPLLQIAWFWWLRRKGEVTTRDCVAITWAGVLLLAVYHLWEVFGLPGSGA
jgi:4-hydroxybenzoate polyprenyltransferase